MAKSKPKQKPKPAPSEANGGVAEPRTPGKREQAANAVASDAQAKRPWRAEVKIEQEGEDIAILAPHADRKGWGDLMRETFGTGSADFCNIAVARIEPVLRNKGETYITEARANAFLAVMGAIAPRDELEASIAGQIVAADALSMDLMMRAKHADTLEKLNAFTNLATKVSRTMAAHVETLAKLRSGGKQQVIVKHVYVNGNAVVADHAQTLISGEPGGVAGAISGQSFATDLASLPAPGILPVRSEDPPGHALPISGGSGEAPLPDARRDEPRSAKGESERSIHMRAVDPGVGGRSPPGAGRPARLREAG